MLTFQRSWNYGFGMVEQNEIEMNQIFIESLFSAYLHCLRLFDEYQITESSTTRHQQMRFHMEML